MTGASSMETSGGVARKTTASPSCMYGFAGAGDAGRRRGAAHGGCAAGVFPMVHQDRFDVSMAAEEVDQLRAAIASISDNSDPLHV